MTFLLFNKNKRKYGVGAIKFDLLLSESHSFNNTISDYNIEDGSVISDHIQNELENGSFSGLFTNFSILNENKGITKNRAQDAFDKLYDMWVKKELIDVYTILRRYEDMAISSIQISKSSEDGESITANISFRKVNVVKLQEVTIEASVTMKGNVNVGSTTAM